LGIEYLSTNFKAKKPDYHDFKWKGKFPVIDPMIFFTETFAMLYEEK